MDSVRGPLDPQVDLSSLSWVHDELRRSLDAAHKSLRRFVKEQEAIGASDVDVVDPAILRGARTSLHQGVGALELVGLPEPAALLRTAEAVVQRYIGKPHKLTLPAVEDVERASFALLDYMARLIAGKAISALALFPQYRRLQELLGAERIHPADLWQANWRWRTLPPDHKVAPIPPDEVAQGMFEAQLLRTMRGGEPQVTAAGMSDLCAGIGMAAAGEAGTLWKLAAAMFEAQAQGLLGFDVYSKRVASRLMVHFKALARGEAEVSERLAQDLLFFCAQSASPGTGRTAPRLAAVRATYALASHHPVDYNVSVLGRHDPAMVAQARKRVVAAKDSWAAVAGGELVRLQGLAEQFALVGESLRRLFPHGEAFGAELQHAVSITQQSASAPSPELAMEVATSLLYVEAALEDHEFDHPDQAARVQRLAVRVEEARRGAASAPLEPWMEELYRRVSDRQTMGSVVQELRAALSEAEKSIDQFFRNPADGRVLIPVPGQLAAMRGVLSVLGMDQAAAALLRLRDEVDALASTAVDPERVRHTGIFDRLAGNLGALGFLIDMLSVQPAMAKSLFVWDSARGTLEPVMGRGVRTPAPVVIDLRIVEQAQVLAQQAADNSVPLEQVARDIGRLAVDAQVADQTGLADALDAAQRGLAAADGEDALHSVRGELSERLVDFVASATEPIGLDPLPISPVPSAAAAGGELDDDDEMRGIFLEEAREVVDNASAACAHLTAEPGAVELLTTLRRAFHTLKGSARMVGLKEFGEAGWICEQIYNTQLADQRAAETPLLDFTAWVLGYLSDWVDEIAARGPVTHRAAVVQSAANRMAGIEELPLPASIVAAPAAPAAPLGLPPDLPSAADLELTFDLDAPQLPTVVNDRAAAPVEEPANALDFELDLAFLDQVDVPPPAEPAFMAEATQPIPLLTEVAEPTPLSVEPIALDLRLDDPVPAPAEPVAAPVVIEAPEPADDVKVVGPLRVAIPLFNIYLSEADELSRRLGTELAEWGLELHRPVGDTAVALAHSLAGSSATVGFADLSALARALENALMHSDTLHRGTPEDASVFVDVADEIRRLLHQFAAGFLVEPSAEIVARLAACDASLVARVAARVDEPPSQLGELDLALPVAEVMAEGDSAFAELVDAVPAGEAPDADSLTLSTPEAPRVPDALEPVPESVRTDALPDAALPVAEPAAQAPLAEEAAAPAPVAEPVVEPVAEVAAEPNPVQASDFLPPPESTFGRDSVFDPLGVAPLRPLTAMERPDFVPSRVAFDDERVVVDEDIDAVDAVDAELFPIFEEEAQELLPQLATALREWVARPDDFAAAAACMRTLHTLKGGARLAGAMRLGELAHRLETRIERLIAAETATRAEVEDLQSRGDVLSQVLEELHRDDAQAYADASAAAAALAAEPAPALEVPQPAPVLLAVPADEPGAPPTFDPEPEVAPVVAPVATPGVELPPIDWARFAGSAPTDRVPSAGDRSASSQAAVRVRVPLLDRLVNHAGEVSITRSRIESSIGALRASLTDLTENLDRLRQQLRDIELQAETQMTSRMEAAKAVGAGFDPLEFDRFTRFQELTRMMAESVNDVATVQRTLQRSIDSAEDELAAQARLTRDLQDDLLRTRMVEFEGLSDRLYRVVRLAAKETHKQVRLDIVGGSIEVDRGVLDRMTPAFEHLLRNCVAHGIEMPAERQAAGKEAAGLIRVAVTQEGNEVGVEFRDDGRGLDLPRIRSRGMALGLLDPAAEYSDADLANLIFTAGFTTVETVTELAGRGIGMDVVKSEVGAMGGRVETASAAGQGTAFKLVLPLTTAVTQVVMVRMGDVAVAIPSTLVEIVRRASLAEIEASAASGSYPFGERALPFFWLGALLQIGPRSAESTGRMRPVLVVRSANQRVAIHVDEVLGNQEVVVKNLGPQLSRMPGLAGMTLLASGVVALIYNPVALATLYGATAAAATAAAMQPASAESAAAAQQPTAPAEPLAPLVMVVDDSLTVRRVTQRLLVREGYRVTLAKDGLEALERLTDERPAVLLSDIEMPRMDGFDLVRNVRADGRLVGLPVIMITSRIAQKHRDYAAELGVDHYLGKPYSEEDLLALVSRYARVAHVDA